MSILDMIATSSMDCTDSLVNDVSHIFQEASTGHSEDSKAKICNCMCVCSKSWWGVRKRSWLVVGVSLHCSGSLAVVVGASQQLHRRFLNSVCTEGGGGFATAVSSL